MLANYRTTIVVALVAVIAAIGWSVWKWTGGSAPTGRPILSLRVNFSRAVTIAKGTPLLFDVSLSGSGQEDAIRIGRWDSLVRVVRAGSDDSLPWAVTIVGQPRSTRIETAPGLPRILTERTETALLARGRTHTIVLAAEPESMANATPGTYQITAVLEKGFWPPWGWRGRVESAPVTVVVSAGGDQFEHERLGLSAQFYLAARRPEDARRVATELVARNRKDPSGWLLLGEAFAALDRQRDALAAYRTALAMSRNKNEAPLLVRARIQEVTQKMAPTK